MNKSIEYCQKYGLETTRGPHVVITTKYPDLKGDIGEVDKDFCFINFNNSSSCRISSMLDLLQEQIIKQNVHVGLVNAYQDLATLNLL